MQCPHCLVGINETWKRINFSNAMGQIWGTNSMNCSECGKIIVTLFGYQPNGDKIIEYMIYPKQTSRISIPPEVEKEFSEDYNEACLILNDSPKASAALSRRCLQNIIRQKAGIKERDLHAEIDKAITSNVFPRHIADVFDAIRHFGNFGAHPIEDAQTGAIITVEVGEAEWLLDILEELFDFYYVQPKRIQTRKEELNKKLAGAGKKPMNEPKSK